MNADADATLEWYGVDSREGRGWWPEHVRPIGEKKSTIVIGGRGDGVNSRAVEGKEGLLY